MGELNFFLNRETPTAASHVTDAHNMLRKRIDGTAPSGDVG